MNKERGKKASARPQKSCVPEASVETGQQSDEVLQCHNWQWYIGSKSSNGKAPSPITVQEAVDWWVQKHPSKPMPSKLRGHALLPELVTLWDGYGGQELMQFDPRDWNYLGFFTAEWDWNHGEGRFDMNSFQFLFSWDDRYLLIERLHHVEAPFPVRQTARFILQEEAARMFAGAGVQPPGQLAAVPPIRKLVPGCALTNDDCGTIPEYVSPKYTLTMVNGEMFIETPPTEEEDAQEVLRLLHRSPVLSCLFRLLCRKSDGVRHAALIKEGGARNSEGLIKNIERLQRELKLLVEGRFVLTNHASGGYPHAKLQWRSPPNGQ